MHRGLSSEGMPEPIKLDAKYIRPQQTKVCEVPAGEIRPIYAGSFTVTEDGSVWLPDLVEVLNNANEVKHAKDLAYFRKLADGSVEADLSRPKKHGWIFRPERKLFSIHYLPVSREMTETVSWT